MDAYKPESSQVEAHQPQPGKPPPPIYYDLAAMLKKKPDLCRVLQIVRTDIRYLGLVLTAPAAFDFKWFGSWASIHRVNTVDFSIRPPNPRILEGGTEMEFHEQHPLLAEVSQTVPNTDGMEVYDPPVKFGLLMIDQTYVIAGQFALRLEYGDMLKSLGGRDEPERQRRAADLQRGLEWLKQFRLPHSKSFPKRTCR